MFENLVSFIKSKSLKKSNNKNSTIGLNESIGEFTDKDFANCVRCMFPDGQSNKVIYKQIIVKKVSRSGDSLIVEAERPFFVGNTKGKSKMVCTFANISNIDRMLCVVETDVEGSKALYSMDKDAKAYFKKIKNMKRERVS